VTEIRVSVTPGPQRTGRAGRLVVTEAEFALTPVPVTATATCGGCDQEIRLMLGQWTDPDGCIACTSLAAPFVPHKPATEGTE
jgi:hypothetical protein